MDWESKGGLDMSGNLVSSLSGPKDSLEFKLILYIILGVVALVIIHVLIDGIRRYIIGLDSAVLGGLLVWLGIKAQDIAVISVVSNLLYLIEGHCWPADLSFSCWSRYSGTAARRRKSSRVLLRS